VYLQDECANPDFNLAANNIRTPHIGYCTSEGTQRYFNRRLDKVHPDNFNKLHLNGQELILSKMMLGTALGLPDKIHDVT